MAAEMTHIKRELLKVQMQVKVMEARKEKSDIKPEQPQWRQRGGRGGYAKREEPQDVLCTKCGYSKHTKEQCRFAGKCFICGEVGHKNKYCRKRKQDDGRTAQPEVVKTLHLKEE